MSKVSYIMMAAVAASMAACASSQPFYWHKTGVTWDQYQKDEQECANIVKGVKPQEAYTGQAYTLPNTNAAAAGIAGGIVGFRQGMERSQLRRYNFATCLQTRGYDKRGLTSAEYKYYGALSEQEKAQQLEKWVAAPNPHHPIIAED